MVAEGGLSESEAVRRAACDNRSMTNDASGAAERTEPAVPSEPAEPAEPVELSESVEPTEPAEPSESAEPSEPAVAQDTETVRVHDDVPVALVRSVRHGRIIVTATAVCAVLGAIAALLFPVAEGAEYTLGQAVGQMLVVGAIAGLVLGAVLSLILGAVARRRRGEALAVHTDVR